MVGEVVVAGADFDDNGVAILPSALNAIGLGDRRVTFLDLDEVLSGCRPGTTYHQG